MNSILEKQIPTVEEENTLSPLLAKEQMNSGPHEMKLGYTVLPKYL